jgi:hypothetical protein
MTTKTNVISLDGRLARPGECLYCHLVRTLETAGCDHSTKLTQRWISAQLRSARWVLRWAESQGGYCDCEVLMNAFRDDKVSARHRKVRCGASYDLSASETLPCQGVQS